MATKPQPFFITGLPRSRTAWMANWLTTDKSVCYHDRTATKELIDAGPTYTGFSGSELIHQFDQLREEYPLAPWLVICRKPDEARRSFEKFTSTTLTDWDERVKRLELMTQYPGVRAVAFEVLERDSMAAPIWNFLVPGLYFNAERWQLLNEMNVQQILQKGLRRVWQH